MQKKLAIGERRGILISLNTRWYTSDMNNAILPHTLAVFAVGSTLVYLLLLTIYIYLVYDTKKYYVQEEWNDNEIRPSVSHVVVYTPCNKNQNTVQTKYFRGFTVVWKRQE